MQFGARVDLHAAGGGFSFDGMLGFDAILQLAPLAFEVEVGGVGVAVSRPPVDGDLFTGRLAGPTPWQVEGKASISLLFFSVSVHFSRTFGSTTAPPLPAAVDGGPNRVSRLADRRNWAVPRVVAGRHDPGDAAANERIARASLGGADGTRAHCAVEPAASRSWAQPAGRRAHDGDRHSPIARRATLADDAGVGALRPSPVEDLRDEQLAQPAFVFLQGGLTVAAEDLAVDDDAGLATPIAYETLLIDPTRPPERPTPGYVLGGGVGPRRPFGAAGRRPPAHADAPRRHDVTQQE